MDDISAAPRLTLDELCQVAREGSPEDQQRLFELLRPHLLRAIRGRLRPPLRRWFDSSDFEQSVWGSLAHLNVGKAAAIYGSDLLAYVCQIARFKIVDHEKALRGDLEKRCGLPSEEEIAQSSAKESDVRISGDDLQAILSQEDAQTRELVKMRLDGVKVPEIAERLNISRATTYRILQRLAQHHRLNRAR